MNHIKRIWLFIAVAGAVVGGVSPSGAGDPTPKLVTEHFMIDASDPSIKLYIRNKRPEGMTEFQVRENSAVHSRCDPAG